MNDVYEFQSETTTGKLSKVTPKSRNYDKYHRSRNCDIANYHIRKSNYYEEE